ncbi:MAG: hypothetical protein JSR37_08235 [Verrucomicrobia bacterium]|nr:hypothetical protein [Verrucomicrobiota bacterium]MBS0635883.1 hypothetical protein [Verrucomicrobiota bacterium]
MAEQAFQKFEQSIEKIERVEKVDPTKSTVEIDPTEEVSAPQKVKFDEALTRADSKWDAANPKTNLVAAEDPVQKLSPIDQMSVNSHRIERLKPVTVDQIVQQADTLRANIQAPIARIEESQKATPNARISPAHDALLTDKLIHVDSSLKTALNKVGVEVTAQEIQQTSGQKPLVKFLNMLSNSDRQLFTLVGEVSAMQNSKERLTPEKLLAVQIKLGFVQSELEFFTNVLNKALEGTKTVMNVQV